MGFPPPPNNSVIVFEQEPPPDQTTFNAGIPGLNTRLDEVRIILFSPNLQLIASMDNSNSKATSDYTTSITHGFTFSTTQSISITSEIGINIEVFTAKVSTTFALSFTEQWNSSTTKSMTFSCPPGEKAFVYQGTLMSKILLFNSETAQYEWYGDTAKALTEILVTSAIPIGSAPSNKVTINQ